MARLRPINKNRIFLSFLLCIGAWASGCSSTSKKTPELSKMEGEKVALVEVTAEPTARRIIETALVNQLLRTGSFELISKQEVEKLRSAPDQNPADLNELARRAGAQYALRAKVLQFSAENHQGYSQETIEDSQLAQERGDGKTERIYRVKSLDAQVQIQLEFTHLKTQEVRSGVAEAQTTTLSDEKTSAIHLPPKLRLLETVTNEAFRKFFEQYH